jgi:hypothetical protein
VAVVIFAYYTKKMCFAKADDQQELTKKSAFDEL